MLHHPLGATADDDLSEDKGYGSGGGGGGPDTPGSCLGGVPHQVRGGDK